MQLIKPNTKIFETNPSTHGKFLVIPNQPYQILKQDFEIATHLNAINEVNFRKISGIYIRAMNETDAVLAAIYCYKKYIHENQAELTQLEDLIDEDEYEDFDLPDELYESLEDGSFKLLPFVHGQDFINAYNNHNMNQSFNQSFAFQQNNPSDNLSHYWRKLPNPLIINASYVNLSAFQNAIDQQNRFIILYESFNNHIPGIYPSINTSHNFELNSFQRDFLFETNFEDVFISKPTLPYLTHLMNELVKSEEYVFSSDVNQEKVIQSLLDYRAENFESVVDIERLIKKAIRYANNQEINESTLLRFFKTSPITLGDSNKKSSAREQLNQLIGLTEVKEDLLRLVERMKFVEKRKQAGYSNLEHHMAAVFMGNPGTAKTTVARIFGQLLFEENVLRNNVFLEVSRKDLIGMYVGWTANKVQEVFDKGAGGTIFIDEAYSLMDSSTSSFSDEAFAAIIQNMENNPDTLVIFAGYTNEMIDFIKNANPGLKSRLTNILQFEDYSTNQLLEIFYHHVTKSNYMIEDEIETTNVLTKFIQTMESIKNVQSGNGRLMRKLLSTAVGHLAIRQPKDMNLLFVQDIERACDELIKSERILNTHSNLNTKIGFHSN